MTLDDHNCRSCFCFFTVGSSLVISYVTDFHKIFRIGSLMGVGDCCEMGLRSLKGCCRGNQIFFTLSTKFFVTKWPMYNELYVVVHDMRDLVSVIHEVDHNDFCWQHQHTMNGHFTPWKRTFSPSDISSRLACDVIRQEVQMLHGCMRTN